MARERHKSLYALKGGLGHDPTSSLLSRYQDEAERAGKHHDNCYYARQFGRAEDALLAALKRPYSAKTASHPYVS